MQSVQSFCHLVQSCSVVFSDVESCSVDFEGSQKCSVDKIKFLLFQENVQSFCHPTEHCPLCASAFQMQQWAVCLAPAPFYLRTLGWIHEGEFRDYQEEMERNSGRNQDSSDEIEYSSDDQSDHREQYDDVDGTSTSSRPNRSSTPDSSSYSSSYSSSDDESVRAMNNVLSKQRESRKLLIGRATTLEILNLMEEHLVVIKGPEMKLAVFRRARRKRRKPRKTSQQEEN